MPNIKEKLIALLCQATFGVNKQTIESYLIPSAIADVADHLIAHGVTVQEWISVKDRLPERKDPRHQRGFYLVSLSNGTVKELAYEYDHYENMLFPVGWHETAYPVTHWMPLPQPPKGE